MIGQIAIAFSGFNDLGRTVTPVFLLMDQFLYQFSAFSEKMKKRKNEENLSTRSLIFLQNARSNSVLFSSSFIGATVSNAFCKIKFCDSVGKIWNDFRNRPTSTK